MSNPYAAPIADLSEVPSDGNTYVPKIYSLQGRIGRLRYLTYGWAFALPLVALGIVFGVLTQGASGKGGPASVPWLFQALGMLPAALVSKRRFNDMDQSSWLALLMLVPYLNVIVSLACLFMKGSEGSNTYGPPAIPNSRGVLLAVWSMLTLIVLVLIVAAVVIYKK